VAARGTFLWYAGAKIIIGGFRRHNTVFLSAQQLNHLEYIARLNFPA